MRSRLKIGTPGLRMGSQSGLTLLETLVAVGIIGMVVVILLSALGTSSKTTMITDERSTAASLARSQMEFVKRSPFVAGTSNYTAAAVAGGSDYTDYSVNITAENRHSDNNIQKITVAVIHHGQTVATLDGYKVNR